MSFGSWYPQGPGIGHYSLSHLPKLIFTFEGIMSNGYISIHRQIWEHNLWNDKPFAKGQAWIDMVMLANHKDVKVPFKGKITIIERGSFIRTRRDLAKRWGWSDSAVQRFIVLLESDQMIVRKSDQKANHICILNYCKYQDMRTDSEPIVNQQRTKSEPRVNLNNNVNKVNNDNNNYTPSKNKKIKFLDCVYLDEIERDKLIKDYTLHGFNKIVQIINDYKMANGKKYKSDYHAIKNWVIDRYRKENKINGIQGNDNGDDNIFLKPLGEEDRPEPDKSVYPDT